VELLTLPPVAEREDPVMLRTSACRPVPPQDDEPPTSPPMAVMEVSMIDRSLAQIPLELANL